MQHQKLSESEPSSHSDDQDDEMPYYKHCTSKYGPSVFWYNHLHQVPQEFSFFVAHEFFDALPIHKFQVIFTAATIVSFIFLVTGCT
jgi:NADH dehydrogenase [ubiquinone] 1 alpha subcomplex assembly factor 7